MIEPAELQDLVARWWWNYDEGNFDVLKGLLTDAFAAIDEQVAAAARPAAGAGESRG